MVTLSKYWEFFIIEIVIIKNIHDISELSALVNFLVPIILFYINADTNDPKFPTSISFYDDFGKKMLFDL